MRRYSGDYVPHLYEYQPMSLPGPGVMNFAFQPGFSLPAEMIYGAGRQYGGGNGLLPFSNGEPFYYMRAQVMDGLNGQPYTGMFQTGLIDLEAYAQQLSAGG